MSVAIAEPGTSWFSCKERWRLAGFYGCVLVLHIAGWGLFLHYAEHYPALVGLGLTAYLFGLRHAFDADHIAAIDDSVRYMISGGKSPLGSGFFFSIGHSTIVFALAVAITLAAAPIKHALPQLTGAGGVVGAAVSGTFLYVVGILNLLLLVDILKIWRHARTHAHSHERIEQLLAKRGLMHRLFGDRIQKHVGSSWQMYPIGVLFGLGFDTATEIGLLAMTAAASATTLPIAATLSLPILFTAGMTVMDTTDGALMCKVYNWAFVNPLRKVFYNLTTTGLSVTIALLIGSIELAQVFIDVLGLKGSVANVIMGFDLGHVGYAIIVLFMIAWGGSVAVWRFGDVSDHRRTSDHAGAGFHVYVCSTADGRRHDEQYGGAIPTTFQHPPSRTGSTVDKGPARERALAGVPGKRV